VRKMTVVLILWCALIVIWAATAASNSNDCVTRAHGQFANATRAGCQVGGGVSVAIILGIGFFGFVFLALIWFMTKPREIVYAVPPPPSPTNTPANWYPDPQVPRQVRYWDGNQWTEHTAPG
jgi:hypothetical protein